MRVLAIVSALTFSCAAWTPATAGEAVAPPPKMIGVTTFAPVAKAVAPSVVTVFSTKDIEIDDRVQEIPPQLRRFFGVPEGGGDLPSQRQQGLGSGVIVSADGYILTNNHVVEGADEIRIALSDQRTEYVATVVGGDAKSDLAVLKVDPGATALTPITWGDSAVVQVGDVVLAVGNPFGVGQTVTAGIISATGRGFGLVDYEDFLQTDAAINRGNSGGALVDIEGRLIGINTAILSPVGVNLGIGFAVPSTFARSIMDQILADGKVTRGYLGVVIQPVSEEIAKAWKLPTRDGALVADVADDGPADEAGLENGDVIVEVDGKPVTDPRHLRLHVAQIKPGAAVQVTVLRDGERETKTVTVGDLADSSVAERDARRPARGGGSLGLGLGDVDDRARAELDIPAKVDGALISQVRPGSPAAEVGLKPGEVITEIDREKVGSAEDCAEMLRERKDRDVILRVWSKAGSRYVVIEAR
ncbi:MAG TPA: Do family serine endopeptidase [Planctomycetota bacterium]|nr:Do family serine endopeptidase [Planctomycetota bacterium]